MGSACQAFSTTFLISMVIQKVFQDCQSVDRCFPARNQDPTRLTECTLCGTVKCWSAFKPTNRRGSGADCSGIKTLTGRR